MANLFGFVVFLLIILAVIVVRRRQPVLDHPFRVPLSVAGVPPPNALLLLTLLRFGYSVYGLTQGEQSRAPTATNCFGIAV